MEPELITKGKFAHQPSKFCKNCVMDNTDPLIEFNVEGVCSYCTNYEEKLRIWVPLGEEKKEELKKMVDACKKAGHGKEYDCIIGVSGGVDSTYVAYLVKNLGLRPLAVHLDNGWNSELAVDNIAKLLSKLQIELYTHVLDWEEFRKLQLAFLRASTPDSEIPSDHAIVALMRSMADKYKIPLIWGVNFTSEAVLPKTWSQGHMDWGYIRTVNKKFGGKKLKKFPHYSIWKLIYFNRISRQPIFNILNYIDYDKEKAKAFLIEQFGWKDYGGKHYESLYTKIYQSYILPVKFGYDKRKAHYSSLILSKQLSREEALRRLEKTPYDVSTIKADILYLTKKLQISTDEFQSILNKEPKTYEEFSPKFPKVIKLLESKLFNFLIKTKRKLLK